MLRTRIITSIVAFPVLIVLTWFGNPWFAIAVALLAIAGVYEFYRITSSLNIKPLTIFGMAACFFLCLIPLAGYINTRYYNADTLKLLFLVAAMIISFIVLLFRKKEYRTLNNWVWTVGGILYIGLMFSYWAEIPNPGIPQGKFWLFWAILVVIVCDVGAYFTGKSLGKHHMAPNISPNKTWEGAAGGLLASILIAILFGYLFFLPVELWQLALLGTIIGVLAQCGDLVESLLKRNAGVKDSGNFFPGHGGVLDRVDSYILVGAVVYYFLRFFVI
jgi:phosphatidate cytidylyltransferase